MVERRTKYKAPRVLYKRIVYLSWICDSWQEHALSPGEATPAGGCEKMLNHFFTAPFLYIFLRFYLSF